MNYIKKYPSRDRLRDIFKYENGKLYHTGSRKRTIAGAEVGTRDKKTGYFTLSIDHVIYQVHRLIYIMHYGDIPLGLVVDHINGNPSDNRIENLQAISQHENMIKQKLVNPKNTSGFRGVTWVKRDSKWGAAIKFEGKSFNLGLFDEIEFAARAYDAAAKAKFGSLAILNFVE